MELIQGLVLAIGALLIIWGIGMIYQPAGMIAAGVILIVSVILDGYDDRDDSEGSEDAK